MPLKRDQYVVDCSDYSNKDRISIFTDSSHNLIYRIVDDFGQIYTIRTPRNQFTYKKGAAYFIYCDYGVAYDFSFMRMYLDRNKIGELFISNGAINPIVKNNDCLIATDISKQLMGKFSLKSLAFGSPLRRNQLDSLTNIMVRFKESLGAL